VVPVVQPTAIAPKWPIRINTTDREDAVKNDLLDIHRVCRVVVNVFFIVRALNNKLK
jgi:hypothetical protein